VILKWTRRKQECRRASVDSAEPKTVQSILRHAKIQTTLDLYTQEDSDETRAAQGKFLTTVGMNATVH
jgi:integrase